MSRRSSHRSRVEQMLQERAARMALYPKPSRVERERSTPMPETAGSSGDAPDKATPSSPQDNGPATDGRALSAPTPRGTA